MDGLTVRPLEPSEGDKFWRTHEKNYGNPLGGVASASHFEWQYLGPPEGHFWITVAEPDSEEARRESPLAAVYAMTPRRFLVDGRSVLGAVSLDTLTDAGYRKRGLFVHLAKVGYGAAVKEGLNFVYGFPNENSMPGFIKHLGWKQIRRMDLVVSIRPWRWLRGRLLGARAERERSETVRLGSRSAKIRLHRVETFDERFDTLWEQASATLSIAAVRDRAFLAWRFGESPHVDYRAYVAEAEADGSLLAACVVRTAPRTEGLRGYVMDVLAAPEANAALSRLMRHVTGALAEQGVKVVVCAIGRSSAWRGALRKAGFHTFPKRFSPNKGILSYAPLDDTTRGLESRPADWHATFSDEDVM